MKSKQHAVTDAAGRPNRMFLSAGHCSDYIGARTLLEALPPAKHMVADRGYYVDWYREVLEDKRISG
jgi:transposase